MLYERSSSGVTRRLLRHVGQWLLPSPCLSCGDVVWEPRGSLGLCPPCRARLVRWPPKSCAVCGRPLGAAALPKGYRCGACRANPPPYERIVSTWSYQPPLDKVLTALKFRRLDYLGDHIGRAMAEIHREDLAGPDLIVPVPLYWTRFLRRGFNQATLLARPLGRALGLPIAQPLGRRRATAHQSRLGRKERRRNLDHAFVVSRSKEARVRGRHVLLVDDVTTTGATATAAATCLRRAGAGAVTVVTAARTPEPS